MNAPDCLDDCQRLAIHRHYIPLDCLKSLGESRKVCTPLQGATTNSQSSEVVIRLLRQSPPDEDRLKRFLRHRALLCPRPGSVQPHLDFPLLDLVT